MTAIWLNDLKEFFRTPKGFAYIAFIQLVLGIMMVMNLFYGSSDYSQVLSNQLVVVALLFVGVPFMTVGALTEDWNRKTDQLVMTSPVSIGDYVIGKYLAILTMYVIPLIISLIQPFYLSSLAEVPVKRIVGLYLGYVFAGAALIGLALFISSFTKNAFIAVLSIYLAFVCLIISDGLVLVLPYDLQKTLGVLITDMSVLGRFQSFITGNVALTSVVFFSSLSVMFVYLTVLNVERRRWS